MTDEKRLRLHVNPAPLTSEGFDARVARCISELRPVIDRLSKRHGVTVVYAALLSEAGDATLAGLARHQMTPAMLDRIAQRLLGTIEDAKGISPA